MTSGTHVTHAQILAASSRVLENQCCLTKGHVPPPRCNISFPFAGFCDNTYGNNTEPLHRIFSRLNNTRCDEGGGQLGEPCPGNGGYFANAIYEVRQPPWPPSRPQSRPQSPPPWCQQTVIYNYVGCYQDHIPGQDSRDLKTFVGRGLTRDKCNAECAERGMIYFSMQYGHECRPPRASQSPGRDSCAHVCVPHRNFTLPAAKRRTI